MSPLPDWQAKCTSHAGVMVGLSSDHGMILAIILFLTVPSLASSVLACLPACIKQKLKSSPLSHFNPRTAIASRTRGSLAMKYRLFIATVLLALSIPALAFLGIAIQIWHFCGEKPMGYQVSVFVWVLFALIPGVTVVLACLAWSYLLGLVLHPTPAVSSTRMKIRSTATPSEVPPGR
ncbi:MAG: hypothetical protein Q9187_003701 [Circinaria calcarea]